MLERLNLAAVRRDDCDLCSGFFQCFFRFYELWFFYSVGEQYCNAYTCEIFSHFLSSCDGKVRGSANLCLPKLEDQKQAKVDMKINGFDIATLEQGSSM